LKEAYHVQETVFSDFCFRAAIGSSPGCFFGAAVTQADVLSRLSMSPNQGN
jgi:hypothetical protein